MNKKLKILSVFILAGFSFFYTDKVVKMIRDNDPIMTMIKEKNKELMVTKIDRIIYDDEYLTGVNGCVINEEKSYDRMRVVGEFKQELLVMKEDKEKEEKNKYIIGGNNKNRNVSIILFDDNIKSKEKINYFFDGKYISDNTTKLIDLKNNIYNLGRNDSYDKKYLMFDNSVINNNFKNKSEYCLVKEKNKDTLDLCSEHGMKTIKVDIIDSDYIKAIRENLINGKIFALSNIALEKFNQIIKYIKTKGYNIIYLNELLNENNSC